MKNKILKLMSIVFLLILLITSCSRTTYNEESMENVKMPKNLEVPLEGTWKVVATKSIDPEYPRDEIINKDISEHPKLYIDTDLVNFGDRYTVVPEFRSKYVNGKSYMEYRYNTVEIAQEIKDRDYEIVSILDGQRFYQDIFVIDKEKNNILLPYDGVFYYLKKESDYVDQDLVKKYKSEYKSSNKGILDDIVEEENIALLLGIKSKDENSSGENPTYKYRTYLIVKNSTEDARVYLTDGLYVPRKQGYWKVDSETYYKDGKREDVIDSHQLNYDANGKIKETDNKNKLVSKSPINITYIDSEYLSLERAEEKIKGIKRYEIHNLDELDLNKPLSIEEIAGKKGREKYIEDLNKIFDIPRNKEIDSNQEDILKYNYETNVGIHRNNGKWVFASNLAYVTEEGYIQKDFDIDLMPTIDILKNNELKFKWSKIKESIPYTIDAVTSPGGNLLVVQNNNELVIYDLTKGISSNDILKAMPIKHSDTIVMTEWATDSMVDVWEKEFKKNKRIPIDFSRK